MHFFRILCAFSVDTLYKISLVNKLFDFNIENKEVLIRKYNNIKDIEFAKEEQAINNDTKKFRIEFRNFTFQKEKMFRKDNKINDDEDKNKIQKSIKLSTRNNKRNNNAGRSNSNIYLKSSRNNKLLESIKLTNIYEEQNPKIGNDNFVKINEEKNKRIINKIKLNKTCIYFCFCFTRKRNNINNIL